MSMSDARLFADLTSRVENLEKIAIRQQALLEELAERVTGKDVHDEVVGPPPDTAARDGLRTLLREQGTRVLQERQSANGGSPGASVDLKPAGSSTEAALQGGEAAKETPPAELKKK